MLFLVENALLSDCSDLYRVGLTHPGHFKVDPAGSGDPRDIRMVHCIDDGWTVVLDRSGLCENGALVWTSFQLDFANIRLINTFQEALNDRVYFMENGYVRDYDAIYFMGLENLKT